MAAAVAALRESTLFVERMLKVTFSISNQPSEIPYCSAPTINAKLLSGLKFSKSTLPAGSNKSI